MQKESAGGGGGGGDTKGTLLPSHASTSWQEEAASAIFVVTLKTPGRTWDAQGCQARLLPTRALH